MYVNGQYSEWIDVRQGTRHGDPLSPCFFLICAKMLSSLIHQNMNIHGIKILDEEILLSQFADDTTFFLMVKRNHFVHVYIPCNVLLQCLVLQLIYIRLLPSE